MTAFRRGLHNLALTLHKTVGELEDTMTLSEFHSWNVYFEEREVQRKRAENKAKGIIDFTDPGASQNLIELVKTGGGRPGARK